MPTSSVAGFVLWLGARGGAEASLGDSHVPWRAAVGKRVRLVCFARFRGRWSVAGVAERREKGPFVSPPPNPGNPPFRPMPPPPRADILVKTPPGGNCLGRSRHSDN